MQYSGQLVYSDVLKTIDMMGGCMRDVEKLYSLGKIFQQAKDKNGKSRETHNSNHGHDQGP